MSKHKRIQMALAVKVVVVGLLQQDMRNQDKNNSSQEE